MKLIYLDKKTAIKVDDIDYEHILRRKISVSGKNIYIVHNDKKIRLTHFVKDYFGKRRIIFKNRDHLDFQVSNLTLARRAKSK